MRSLDHASTRLEGCPAMPDFAARVLKLVSEPDYKPITLKAMSRRFEVDADDYAEFRATVKRLVKEGKLDLAKDKTLRRPDQAGLIVGVFRRSAKGFGFVRPHTSTAKTDQIYIPPEASGDASSGDEVAVKITKRPQAAGDEPRGPDRPDPGAGLGRSSSAPTSRRAAPASSRSTARPSTTRSTSATPAPRGPSRATRSPSRWSATRRPTSKARGSSPRSSASAASRGSTR